MKKLLIILAGLGLALAAGVKAEKVVNTETVPVTVTRYIYQVQLQFPTDGSPGQAKLWFKNVTKRDDTGEVMAEEVLPIVNIGQDRLIELLADHVTLPDFPTLKTELSTLFHDEFDAQE